MWVWTGIVRRRGAGGLEVWRSGGLQVGGSGGLEVWSRGHLPMEEEQEVSRRLVRRLQV